MKYLFVSIGQLLIFQSFLILAQEVKPLKPLLTTKYNDEISNIIEIGDNQFLYSANKVPLGYNPDHILYHEIDGQFSSVVLTDLNNKMTKEYLIIVPNDYTLRLGHRLIYDKENEQIIVVGIQNSLEDRKKLFTIILNSRFAEIIGQKNNLL